MFARTFALLWLLKMPPIQSKLMDGKFIEAYFVEKSLGLGNIYTCRSREEIVNAFKKTVMKMPLSVKQVNASLEDTLFAHQNNHLGMVLDMDCKNLESFFQQCNNMDIFDYQHHWLFLSSSHSAIDYLNNLNLNINSDLKLAVPQNKTWLLYDVYKSTYKYNTPLNVTFTGIYARKRGIKFFYKHRPKYEERRNFTGVEFKTAIVLPNKFEGRFEDHVRSDEHREINTFNRVNAILNYYCGDYYNFTMKMKRTNSWGYLLPNGTFDGIVRELELREIDFGMSSMFFIKMRYPYVDYGRTTWLLGSSFVFRHPKSTTSFEVFLRPLDSSVWLVIFIASIAIIVLMQLIIKLEKITLRTNRDVDAIDSAWSSLILFIVGTLCQQGNPNLPVFLSGRIVCVFAFITSVLIYQFYSGSIVSYLLMKPPTTLKTVEQLAGSDLKIGCENVKYTVEYFKILLQRKDVKQLSEKRFPNQQFYLDVDEGLKLVAAGGFAYHVELTTAYPIIEKTFNEDQICELEEIPLFVAKPLNACFPKRSPLRKMFNFLFVKMSERGIMHRTRIHYHARRPDCIRLRPPTTAVGIKEFYPALIILAFGMVMSAIVLAAELIIDHRN